MLKKKEEIKVEGKKLHYILLQITLVILTTLSDMAQILRRI